MSIDQWTAAIIWTCANILAGGFIGYVMGTVRQHRSTK